MNWRRWLAVAVILMLCASPAFGQRGSYRRPPRPATGGATTRFEITPVYGLQWGGTISTYEGDLVLEDSGMWGVIVDATVRSGAQVELLYWRQDTDVVLDDGFAVDAPLFEAAVEYWQIGGLYEFRQTGNLRMFGTLSMGATHVDPKPSALDDDWRFSTIFGIGTKVFVSDRIALRLQASMPVTFIQTSGGMFCGPGGCYTTLGGMGIAQGNLLAGLTFAF
ncbi:MAG: hypothetical protein V3T20_03760 [Gemmatimonadota bacterium]